MGAGNFSLCKRRRGGWWGRPEEDLSPYRVSGRHRNCRGVALFFDGKELRRRGNPFITWNFEQAVGAICLPSSLPWFLLRPAGYAEDRQVTPEAPRLPGWIFFRSVGGAEGRVFLLRRMHRGFSSRRILSFAFAHPLGKSAPGIEAPASDQGGISVRIGVPGRLRNGPGRGAAAELRDEGNPESGRTGRP